MPKPAGRTSARSSVSRDYAQSPPKPPIGRRSQSPRRTRSGRGRSQSAEPGESSRNLNKKLPGRRGIRQGSVESVDSNTNATSSRKEGHKKDATRALVRDLPVLVEDREDDDQIQADDDEDDADGVKNMTNDPSSVHSPSTAFSPASSHFDREMASIQPRAATKLPELYTISLQILQLLAPKNASKRQVETIIKDLHISESACATTLRELEGLEDPDEDPDAYYDEEADEATFSGIKKLFGNDKYVQRQFVLEKLLGEQNTKEGDFRPDAVIHAANLAIMVKELLVVEQGSPKIRLILMDIESKFPQQFITSFDDGVQFGSTLFDATFKTALEIRTQFIIASLRDLKETRHIDPYEILIEEFYEKPDEENLELDYFENILTKWSPKGLPGGPALSEDQAELIKERVLEIRSTFREGQLAKENEDMIDFEQLEELFPWLDFLTIIVNWSRTQLNQISKDIHSQGGVPNISRQLVEASQRPPSVSPTARRSAQLEPAAEIFQQSMNSKEVLLYLMKKKMPPVQSSKSEPMDKPSRPPQRKTQAHIENPVTEPFSDDFILPNMGDDEDAKFPMAVSPRPTAEYMASVEGYSNERNKENRPAGRKTISRSLLDRQSNAEKVSWDTQEGDKRPVSSSHQAPPGKQSQKPAKRSMLDRQPDAVRERWSSQESDAGPSTKKRSRPDPEEEEDGEEEEEEEASEDEGFEQDRRIPDPSRKRKLPPVRQNSPMRDNPRASKRARVSSEDATEVVASRTSQDRSRDMRQHNPKRPVDDDDAEMGTPAPTARQISQLAINAGIRARISSQPQKRTPWSDEDTDYLIAGIEQYGAKWSVLWKLGGWQVERGQVALKDKGRNLKVMFLKANVPLPVNFENIPLGKKEIAAVKAVRPDWEP